MAVGCYVIGEDVIHTSIPILPSRVYAPENCVSHFTSACKELPQKLWCLVIVDSEFTTPGILKQLLNIGKEYANFIYFIPAIVALLQHTVTNINHFAFDEILILVELNNLYYACRLTKKNNLIYPLSVKTETINSLHHYSGLPLKDVHCIYQHDLGKYLLGILKFPFPNIKFHHSHPPRISLALGGFLKAKSVTELGKHLEVLNFCPGIYNGNIPVVNRCAAFPVKVRYTALRNIPTVLRDTLTVARMKNIWEIIELEVIIPAQSVENNYVIEYNKFGFLTIKDYTFMSQAIYQQQLILSKDAPLSFDIFTEFLLNLNIVHVWSIKLQVRVIFDVQKQCRHFDPLNDKVKNLFSNEWLNAADQTTEFPSPPSDLHTVFVDNKKIYNYINGPRISIAPSYIGILQYYVTYFKPTTPHLIILIILKNGSKLYALNQRSSLCYTVTYISDYSETLPLFDSNSVKKKTEILYIHEKGMNQKLASDFISTNISVTRFQISNLEEVMFYGGAIYALHNSSPTLTSPYVTINPLFDPEENAVDGLSTVSHRTCCYEIEAFFHGALKSINSNLFYGDLIAILLRRKDIIHVFFFVHVAKKFLFKFEITVPSSTVIDASLLHFADCIIADLAELFKAAKNMSINLFKWDKHSGIHAFLKDLNEEKLLIYDSPNYSEAIARAENDEIFGKTSVTIEYKKSKCRIIYENYQCDSKGGQEWIPMFISFSQTLPIFGKEAGKDVHNCPESVIYDFIKLIGVTSKTLLFDSKWKFQVVEMDASDDPKIGFKVKTIQGYKIISPEIATTIYLRNLVNLYEKHIGKSVDEIRFQLLDTVLNDIQKEAFKNAAKRLNKILVFC